jgi:pimeloyl-ACP methyl ester carboxylesterase
MTRVRTVLSVAGLIAALMGAPDQVAHQRIAWHDCRTTPNDETGEQLAAAGARCGEVTVPLDYANPSGRTITVAIARRPATDTAHRRGTLVINTGGPGPSRDGVVLLARRPSISTEYDLVGIDPRFFGLSTPLECGWPIAYLGWSFGTHLGAVYLQMFGERTDRIVLDSAMDPDAAGPRLTRKLGPADAAALRDWARWAAQHDEHLGDTEDDVLAVVAEIAQGPLQVGDHPIDTAMIPGLLLTAEDTDAFYAELSAEVRVLRDAALGFPVTPTPDQEQRLFLYDNTDVIPEFGFSALVANQCADRAAPRDPEVYFRDVQAHLDTEPLFGPLFRDITPCAFWPVRPQETLPTITTGHPALLVGASGDPTTPYTGQQALHRALTGSRMITLDDAYRHGVYLFDPATCVTDAVESYLLGGTLPSADVTCARDPQ